MRCARVSVDGSAPGELRGYAIGDCERFLHTLALVPEARADGCSKSAAIRISRRLLLRRFRPGYRTDDHELLQPGKPGSREPGARVLRVRRRVEEHSISTTTASTSKRGRFRIADASFDVIVFCEVLEHMTNDPMHALREIARVLKPGGLLVLTTPNVARIENVIALLEGRNIYDPYSGYGPYGRHNREYTRDELHRLLAYCGFDGRDELHGQRACRRPGRRSTDLAAVARAIALGQES